MTGTVQKLRVFQEQMKKNLVFLGTLYQIFFNRSSYCCVIEEGKLKKVKFFHCEYAVYIFENMEILTKTT